MTLPEIDPAVVRTIVETAFRSTTGGPAERVEAALIAFGAAGPVVSERFDAWSKAVGAEYERLAAAARGATGPVAPAMSDERVAELHKRAASTGLRYGEVTELFKEMERLRKREAALVDEVDGQAEQLRRTSAELVHCTDLNRDLVATNTNLAETVKEARERIRELYGNLAMKDVLIGRLEAAASHG